MSTLSASFNGAGFNAEQKEYLSGLFAGIAVRGQRFSDVEPAPKEAKVADDDLILEERIKREFQAANRRREHAERAERPEPRHTHRTLRPTTAA